MAASRDHLEAEAIVFADDGLVPNNPMPFLIYKAAVNVDNVDPEGTIEGLFGANGWGDIWRDGIFDYLHYHATVHEALGVARGHARVRFGGDHGQEIPFRRVTSSFCPPAPDTSGSPRAAISASSARIRRGQKCR